MTAKAALGNKRPFRMIAGVSTLADLADGAGALGALVAAGGNWYYCNPTNGSSGGDALTAATATNSLETAYGLCRSGYNDGVFFIGGATAFNPTAAFTWANDYCHLIGLSADLPGNGQRCRIVALNATALTTVMTVSGDGCAFSNIQFNNELSTGASGSITVTGDRNMFVNCFFMNPASLTAASWALKLSGDECSFIRCSIGQTQSRVRTNADYGAWLLTSANGTKFIGCEFKSWSDATTHDPVFIDAITSEGWSIQFEDCLWQNLGNALCALAIDDNHAQGYHQLIFRGENLFVKMTAVSDQLSYTYVADTKTDATSGLLAVAIAES